MHRVCKSEAFERPQNILMQRFMVFVTFNHFLLSVFVDW